MTDFLFFLLELFSLGSGRGPDPKAPPPRRPLLRSVFAGVAMPIGFQVLGMAALLLFALVSYPAIKTSPAYVFIGTGLIVGAVVGWALFREFESLLARQPPDRYPPAEHPLFVGVLCGSVTLLPFLSASYLIATPGSRHPWYVIAIGALSSIVLAVVVARHEHRRASTWPPTAPRAAQGDALVEGREKDVLSHAHVAPADLTCPRCADTFPSRYWFVDTPSGPLCQNCVKNHR